MKSIFIKEKLKEMGVVLEDIRMGDFDIIGEYTAKKNRSYDTENYQKYGCFFRPNYERGILMYYLIGKFKVSSVLEVGFGRGYSAFCMAKAMVDFEIDGKITTVDPNFNKDLLNDCTKIFPKSWFDKIQFIENTSDDYLKDNSEKYDFIYIDGDHTYEGVKKDWENCKERFNKILLFDDYHLPTKNQKDIDCAKLIDEIDDESKELILMDRRIFFDDRRVKDDDLDYGQVLLTKEQ